MITTTLPAKSLKYEIWYNATALRYNMYADAGVDRLSAYAESESSVQDTRLKDTSFMLIVQRMVDEVRRVASSADEAPRRSWAIARLRQRPMRRLNDSTHDLTLSLRA